MKQMLLLFPFYRRGNRSSEKLSKLLKIIQPLIVEPEFVLWAQPVWLQSQLCNQYLSVNFLAQKKISSTVFGGPHTWTWQSQPWPSRSLSDPHWALVHGRLRALGENPNQKAPSIQIQEPAHQWPEGMLTNENLRNIVIGEESRKGHTEPCGYSTTWKEDRKNKRKGSFKGST